MPIQRAGASQDVIIFVRFRHLTAAHRQRKLALATTAVTPTKVGVDENRDLVLCGLAPGRGRHLDWMSAGQQRITGYGLCLSVVCEFDGTLIRDRCARGAVTTDGVTEGDALVRSVLSLPLELDSELLGGCAVIATRTGATAGVRAP